MSIATRHSPHESLLSDLTVKKLKPEGRWVRTGEREKITHSPLFVPGFAPSVELLKAYDSAGVMLRNELLRCYFLIKRLLKRHRDHLELHAIRSRVLPDGALKDDYVIRVQVLNGPKDRYQRGFPIHAVLFLY